MERSVVEVASQVMEIRDGLIQHHRVYWGWYSVKLYEELQRKGQLRS